MGTIVLKEPEQVCNRLLEMGLEAERIRDCVRQGYLARAACTAHNPRTYPGMAHWAEAVNTFRDNTKILGWSSKDDDNCASQRKLCNCYSYRRWRHRS